MKAEINYLIGLELRNLYGFNRFRHTKDTKARRTYLSLAGVFVLLILMIFLYVGALVVGLSKFGLAEIVPAYLVTIASLIIFIFGMLKAGSTIFSSRSYDIISSLPLRQSSIVISRFSSMYVEDLALTLLILLPGMTMYGVCNRPAIGFYFVMLIGGAFVPALPLVLSTVLGAVITAISSRMKHKALMETLLTVLLVVAILIGSMSIGSFSDTDVIALVQNLTATVNSLLAALYPPALWLGTAAVQGKIAELLLFVAVSILSMAVAIIVISRYFHAILRRLLTTSAKHNYKLTALKTKGALSAFYRREVKRYFCSPIYVTNTIIGPVMGLLLSVGLLITGMDSLRNALPLPLDLEGLVPFLLAAVFTMMTTTSCSISLEGKHLWIVKTLPIPTKIWLDGKLLLNLSLHAPFYLLSEVCLILALKPDLPALLWLLLIPAVMILFAVVFGITANLLFPKFDWEKEESVVKQSASAAIGGFAGMLLSLLCCGLVAGANILLGEQWLDLVKAGICIVLLAVTGCLYRKNNKASLQKL